MKKIYFSLLLLLTGISAAMAQGKEASLLGNWHDETIVAALPFLNVYNDIWGTTINGLEIAIIGSTEGTHFIDVTDPANLYEIEAAFVPGQAQGTRLIHRDFHSFGDYVYVVADENALNGDRSTLQIIDMSGLPNSTEVVYDSEELLNRSHNVFIDEDNARLYACGVRGPVGPESIAVYSLDDPENPVKLGSYPADFTIPYVHDAYIRDNIGYLNCASDGLYIVDFTDPQDPILIGTMSSYTQQGYNHSGWLDPVSNFYFMADETHGMNLKTVDVSDGNDIHVINTFNTGSGIPTSIPHNLIVHGDMLYVSYYYEGLQVFDISDPQNPVRAFYYDTYDGVERQSYEGAWGVYPFLPSGNILVSDMQSGLFVFTTAEITSTEDQIIPDWQIGLYPQPANEVLSVNILAPIPDNDVQFSFYDLQGRLLWEGKEALQAGTNTIELNAVENFNTGVYLLQVSGERFNKTEKVIIK